MSYIVSLLYLSLGKIKPVANEEEKKHEAKIALYIVIVFSNSVHGIVVSSTCYMHKAKTSSL